MYSYDDRLRAVQLYIKLGKRVGLTIRQLGYPTKNALKSWHREYEQRQDLPPATCVSRSTRRRRRSWRWITTCRATDAASRSRSRRWATRPGRCCPAGSGMRHPEARRGSGRSHGAPSSQAKQSAVIALCMRPGSAQAVAQELGVSRPSLYNWKNQLLGHDVGIHEAPARPRQARIEPNSNASSNASNETSSACSSSRTS
jgi:transposase-like protein